VNEGSANGGRDAICESRSTVCTIRNRALHTCTPSNRPVSRGLAFALLGSGSEGNAALIECGATAVLLDCGFSARETAYRLQRLARDVSDVAAILLTHEHSDHVRGVGALARRWDIPVWMTEGTRAALPADVGALPRVRTFSPHEAFEIGDLRVQPFPVPHDAREPCQYVFSDGDARLAFLTDAGVATPHIESMLSGCVGLVLECNHDRGMLRDGPYPASLKARIASDVGHLANDAAAALLARLDTGRLRHVAAAHLSRTNNTPRHARAALAGALNCAPRWVDVADQDRGLDFRTLTESTI
jgi:phosphoribosyl 1,2-cyclic phosphodiesterase